MSNGLGAAFGGLLLLAVLAGLATLLALTLGVVVVVRRRRVTIPRGLRSLSVALLAGVVTVAGFGVVALYDEAATLAAVFLAMVAVPLAVVGIALHRRAALSRLDTIAATGLAWSLPFLLGLAVTFGGLNVVTRVFELAPAESQRLGLQWLATTVGGGVVVGSALWLSTYVRSLIATGASS